MTSLPRNLYRAAAVRELDRLAGDALGVTGLELMTRAGQAAFVVLRTRWPQARQIAIVCGPGNNGGDGLVIARLAAEAGMSVAVFLAADAGRLSGAAAQAYAALQAAGLMAQSATVTGLAAAATGADVIVDALFGTGLDRDISADLAAMIGVINGSRVPILALDIPSGLHADSGQILGQAIEAAATVSFIGLKQGLLTGQGPACCGELYFDDLQAPAAVYMGVSVSAWRIDYTDIVSSADNPLLPRRRSAHKGDFGHVLVVGGDRGMAGAVQMAAEAAARVGAGLVSVATHPEHAAQICAVRPELMVQGTSSPGVLTLLMARATVIVVGPGLGQRPWGRDCLVQVLDRLETRPVPLVIDADGLNLLAQESWYYDRWVLTPHPGEAARLLGVTTAMVQADRFAAAQAIQQRYGGVCVLKGAGTVIQAMGDRCWVCSEGNPGMASGGMGDVLSGIIAGLLAQGIATDMAAVLGVCVHARGADIAASGGERGLLATDLMPVLRRLVNPGEACAGRPD